MKSEHRDILNKIESYLSKPGSEHLRFWQAMYNMELVVFEDRPQDSGFFNIKDDYNISDEKLLKRIK